MKFAVDFTTQITKIVLFHVVAARILLGPVSLSFLTVQDCAAIVIGQQKNYIFHLFH
jgi:hypothetical protein